VCTNGGVVGGRVARPKKLKRLNLAISCFNNGQILKNVKRPNFGRIFVEITESL
jgi:hypothetical protein